MTRGVGPVWCARSIRPLLDGSEAHHLSSAPAELSFSGGADGLDGRTPTDPAGCDGRGGPASGETADDGHSRPAQSLLKHLSADAGHLNPRGLPDMTDSLRAEAERAALRIVVSNVVARLVVSQTADPMERRELLSRINDECKLAANHALSTRAGDDQRAFTDQVFLALDEFFKGITIT
jgi:hypothetical protein